MRLSEYEFFLFRLEVGNDSEERDIRSEGEGKRKVRGGGGGRNRRRNGDEKKIRRDVLTFLRSFSSLSLSQRQDGTEGLS